MYAEKLLPHDVEAEEAIIGSLLIDGDSILRVSSVVKPEDFYREKNRLCYAALPGHPPADSDKGMPVRSRDRLSGPIY